MGIRLASFLLVILLSAVASPAAQHRWPPPDVDSDPIELNLSAKCDLAQVMQSASERVEELVRNLDRYTATEHIEHFELRPTGSILSRETRRFNYLVEIHQVGTTDLDVEEHRSGWMPTEKIRGLPDPHRVPWQHRNLRPTHAGVDFSSSTASQIEFACEGLGSWQGRPAWVVHFRQRAGQSNSMLTYHVNDRSAPVGLRGRASIDTETSQIVAMESNILHPVPEIQLSLDHQLIEYGPVRFRSKSLELWLPKSADWYCALRNHRYYRRHTFTGFLLYSVDDKEELGTPAKPSAN